MKIKSLNWTENKAILKNVWNASIFRSQGLFTIYPKGAKGFDWEFTLGYQDSDTGIYCIEENGRGVDLEDAKKQCQTFYEQLIEEELEDDDNDIEGWPL